MNRRQMVTGTAAIPAVAFAATLPIVASQIGPIETLLLEYRRRDRFICEEFAKTGEDIEGEQTDWIDEPLELAIGIEPTSTREFAALTRLMLLDDAFMAGDRFTDALFTCAGRILEGVAKPPGTFE